MVVIALVSAICLFGDSALYVLLPSRLEAFAVTPTGAGLILGINRYIRILSNSWAGRMYERFGFYPPFTGAVALAVLTTAGYGAFAGFWPLFIAHALWGVAWSLLRLGGYLAVIDAAQGTGVGRFMGALQGISRGGSLIAVLLGGALADAIGGRDVFLVYSVVMLAAFVLVPFSTVRSSLGQHEAPPEGHVAEGGDTWRIRALYLNGAIVWLAVAGMFVATAGYLVRTVAGDGAVVFGLVLGVGALSGALVAVRWVGDLAFSPILGHLADRYGRSPVLVTAMSTAIVAMVVVALRPTLPVAFPSFAVVFLSASAIMVTLNASIADQAPLHRRTSVLSRYATWADIGSGTGPIIGLPAVTTLGFGWAYGIAAMIMAVGLAAYAAAFLRRTA